MYRVDDHIDGQAIAIVYQAPQLPQPVNAGWWTHSKAVRQFVAANQAQALLRTEDGELVTWHAGPQSGVSFAAALDAWLEGASLNDASTLGSDGYVIVPLDQRIYWARFEDGFVSEERVTSAELAVQELTGWLETGATVHAFAGGAESARIERHVQLEAMPFDLWQYRYRRILPSFVRARLFHPAYAALLAAVAVVPLLLMLYQDQATQAARNLQSQLAQRQQSRSARTAEFSGAPRVALLKETLADPALTALHRAGLASIGFDARTQLLTYRGDAPGRYPTSARAFAEARGGVFRFDERGWTIERGITVLSDARPVEVAHDTLVQRLYAADRRIGVALTTLMQEGEVITVHFDLTLPRPIPFTALAAAFAGRPYAVQSFACELGKWRLKSCLLSGSLKGLVI